MTVFLKALSGSVVLLVILLTSACSGNDSDQKSQPNILLILADDLGVNDIGSWGDGTAPTPTLDALSRESVRFRQFYTDSTCSVSRAALLTGRQPVNIGFEPDGLGLSPDLSTLPKTLKSLGYQTHHIGKWHVGEADEYPQTWPLKQSFDDWFGMYNHFRLRGPEPDGSWVRKPGTHINPWLHDNNMPARQYTGHLDDLLTDRAVSVIKKAAPGKPWFINLWLYSPHHPFEPSETFRKQFPDTEAGRYLALLSQLDSNVARLIQALKSTGQSNNTIVIFTSDNGGFNIGRDNNWPLIGTKNTYLEGGVRVPLLIHYPHTANRHDVYASTHITDLYPTIIGMLGGKIEQEVDGLDLTALINAKGEIPERNFYWARDNKDWGMNYAGAIRGEGGFSRDTFGALESFPITGGIKQIPNSAVGRTFSREEASSQIREWEMSSRLIPLNWHAPERGRAGYLSGRNFQRTPAFGSYTLGLSLFPKGGGTGRHVLIEQPGVWQVWLDEDMQLFMKHGETHFRGPKLTWGKGCNSLVVSLGISPASAHPFPTEASSIVSIYLNGSNVMHDKTLIHRPNTESLTNNPTYIGSDHKGAFPFPGEVSAPILIGKYLKPDQEGLNLQDMDNMLCSKVVPN